METYRTEKRRFPRHPVSSPIRYSQAKSRSKSFSGSITVDISEGGICFLAGLFMPRGSVVQFTIPVSDQVFCVEGKTTYSAFIDNISFYRTGVEFQNPQALFKAKLAEQVTQIKEYRQKLSEKMGNEVSEKEAAYKWVEECGKHFSYLF